MQVVFAPKEHLRFKICSFLHIQRAWNMHRKCKLRLDTDFLWEDSRHFYRQNTFRILYETIICNWGVDLMPAALAAKTWNKISKGLVYKDLIVGFWSRDDV